MQSNATESPGLTAVLYMCGVGRRHSLDKRRWTKQRMRIELPAGCPHTLEEIVWDVETLRILMQQMIERCHSTPMDLIQGFDRSGEHDDRDSNARLSF